MVKPGPDGEGMANGGWAPMPERVKGFSQTHVSGTGGGQKYGNVLIQPLAAADTAEAKGVLLPDGTVLAQPTYYAVRTAEEILPAYYACTYASGIRTEITAAARCALYRFTSAERLWVDAVSFLGMDTIPDKRETQQFVGSHIEIRGDSEMCGWTSVRGGWNNGTAYTVFFCIQTDEPFTVLRSDGRGALVAVAPQLTVRVGISYVSMDQARQNIVADDFDVRREALLGQWDALLSRVPYDGNAREKRIFYTALYHTLLMPTDKRGEAPAAWTTDTEGETLRQEGDYWDDYYALWDTYRTSFPLLMEYYPEMATSMARALLNIYDREGYMPDARSGDCNGRTQGGSHGAVVLADALARELPGIDYGIALRAMVHDADDVPEDDEKEGRGGLHEYISLGYIPYGTARAGTRTVEYSYDDWCVAQVARQLGDTALYKRFMQRSDNWRNLWRADYEWQGMRGFIMPRAADGQWLDSVVWGRSQVFRPKIAYMPDTKVAPWHIAWWDTFFYEALSAEYSLAIPHDVTGLITLCGGAEKFRQRLDTFFDNGHYNVGNEPSFLTPYLYHYIDRPDLSSARVSQIVRENFSDSADGLPGNDDGGAMSAWLVWAMLGKYPALPGGLLSSLRTMSGQPLQGDAHYLFFDPVHFDEEADGTATAEDAGQGYAAAAITTPTDEKYRAATVYLPPAGAQQQGTAHFTLNRQYRNWAVTTQWDGDTLQLYCNGCRYDIPRSVTEDARSFCWASPYRPGKQYEAKGTFLFLSRRALRELLDTGKTVYDDQKWQLTRRGTDRIRVRAEVDGTEMAIALDRDLPWVVEMKYSALGIDWTLE